MLSTTETIQFNEGLATYQYFTNGLLDLEDFSVTLSACMLHDGSGQVDARPENFHNLLVRLIHERLSTQEQNQWIHSVKLTDWTPQIAYLYPTGHRTLIHIAALMKLGFDWISLIGSHTLEIPEEKWTPEYFGWIQDSWHFTKMFMLGYHNALFELCKQVDLTNAQEGRVSSFETLRLTQKKGISYEQATQELKIRNAAWSQAIERITQAEREKYPLEAITLIENLAHNMLYNFLSDSKKVNQDSTFNSLIAQTKVLQTTKESIALLEELDQWRKQRNDAIHNFLISSIDSLSKNQNDLSLSSEATAKEGLKILKRLLEWYRYQSINFVSHNFKQNTAH